jgi:5,10-methylenetetrahydromethanopterin reductase
MRLALTFYSVLRMPIEDLISCSIAAENAAFEYISMAESFFRDASVLGTAIASKTNKVKFGSSIFPIPTRTPFQIAMATATLNEFSGGRVGFIGLGTGYRSRIEKYFGVKIEHSLTKMKEYAEIIKGLLLSEVNNSNDTNGSFSHHGKFFSFENFPILVSEPLKVPILFASSGDNMLELAGRFADGVILNSTGTPEYYRHAASVLGNAQRKAGRASHKLEVAASIIFSVADRYEDAIKAARPDVLFYLSYPELDPVINKTPYKDQVAQIRKLNAEGKTKEALTLVSDKMVDDLSVSGTPKECRSKIEKLADHGVTLPIIRVSVQPFKEGERKEVFLKAIDVLRKIDNNTARKQ